MIGTNGEYSGLLEAGETDEGGRLYKWGMQHCPDHRAWIYKLERFTTARVFSGPRGLL